jgi:hypothetical protein
MSDTARNISESVDFPSDWAEKAEDDGPCAIACGLYVVARELHLLGNGDVHHHGAVEGFSMHIGEKLDRLTDVISELSQFQEERK